VLPKEWKLGLNAWGVNGKGIPLTSTERLRGAEKIVGDSLRDAEVRSEDNRADFAAAAFKQRDIELRANRRRDVVDIRKLGLLSVDGGTENQQEERQACYELSSLQVPFF